MVFKGLIVSSGPASGRSARRGNRNPILRLTPETETQRWFKSEALKLCQDVVKTRWRILESSGGSGPVPFLIVVIFWLTATFASFGLYAPRNATVVAVLLVAAVSVAAAVFLVLELDGPFDGLIEGVQRTVPIRPHPAQSVVQNRRGCVGWDERANPSPPELVQAQ